MPVPPPWRCKTVMMLTRTSLLWLAVFLLCYTAWPRIAHSQLLQGEWVDQAQAQVREHRMGDLRVIVLDGRGQPARDCTVRIIQQQHAFRIGLTIDEHLLATLEEQPESRWTEPVMRTFNALALDGVSRWDRVEPNLGQYEFDEVQRALQLAESRGLSPRWGTLLSEDIAYVPPWIAQLKGPSLQATATHYAQSVVQKYGQRVGRFDMTGDRLRHRLLRDRVGPNVTRMLHQRVQAAAPHTQLNVRYEDSLSGPRAQQMIEDVIRLRDAFVPVHGISLEARFGGMVVQRPLGKALSGLHRLQLPVDIVNLQVGGPGATAAAMNMETVLLRLFAEPAINGIYFRGLTREQYGSPEPELINPIDQPTEAGLRLDQLFREVWWTRIQTQADGLGNVRARVFLGTHRVEAEFADGTRAWTEVTILPEDVQSNTAHTVILQPVGTPRLP